MSLDTQPESPVTLSTLDPLLDYFRAAETAPDEWRVGLEHEKLAVLAGSFDPVPYSGPRGIRELLRRAEPLGFRPFVDEGSPVAAARDGEWISLEPGGQVELSGRPWKTACEAAVENRRHLRVLSPIARELGVSFVGLGYRPAGRPDGMPMVPKRRYRAMRRHLLPRGAHALDMMTMTASVQASVDYSGEEDCAEKVRTAASVSSLIAAMYANSPIVGGRASGFQSFRYQVWKQVDAARTGLLPMFFDEEGFTYRRYVEWASQVPAMFVRRSGRYLELGGIAYGRFLREGYGDLRATWTDFTDHLSTLFPEVRVKKVIELRSADSCDVATSNGLAALARGVLYDATARVDALRLTQRLTFEDRLVLQELVAREALRARVPGSTAHVWELCADLLEIAREGLVRLHAPKDVALLAPLEEIAVERRTPADRALDAFAAGGFDALLRATTLADE